MRWYAKKRCVCACPERWGYGAPLRVLRDGAAPTLRREDDVRDGIAVAEALRGGKQR